MNSKLRTSVGGVLHAQSGEPRGKLPREIGEAVHEEQEYGRALVGGAVVLMSTTFFELMSKIDPLFLAERQEAVDCATLGVEHHDGQHSDLRGSVPAVGACDDRRLTTSGARGDAQWTSTEVLR